MGPPELDAAPRGGTVAGGLYFSSVDRWYSASPRRASSSLCSRSRYRPVGTASRPCSSPNRQPAMVPVAPLSPGRKRTSSGAPGSRRSGVAHLRDPQGSPRPGAQPGGLAVPLPPPLLAHPDTRVCGCPGRPGGRALGELRSAGAGVSTTSAPGTEGPGCPRRLRAQLEVVFARNPLISHPQGRVGTGRRGHPVSRPPLEGSNPWPPDAKGYRALSGYRICRTVWGLYQQDPRS